jgi:hypothetical protein
VDDTVAMTSLRLLGAAVAGVGGGLLIATVVDAATGVGVAVLVLGAAMVAVGWRSGSDGETIGVEVQPGAAPVRKPDRPTLSGLGTRVEHILHLAEQQAETFRQQARHEAEAIVAAAHEEARAIRARAESPEA